MRGVYSGDCAMVYAGTNGPITTRRWEAFRDGAEDYECLMLLKKYAPKAKGANEFLERIRGKVPDSAEPVHQLRDEMLTILKSIPKEQR